MATFVLAGWTFGVTLANLLNTAKSLAKVSDYMAHGLTADIRHARVAEIVNLAIESYLEDNPLVGRSTAALALVAGTQAYAIPVTTRRSDIVDLYYDDTGSSGGTDLLRPDFVDRAFVQQLAQERPEWVNGTVSADYPMLVGFDETRANLVFYPAPAAVRDLTVVFRPAPTLLTGANVASPAETINEVPARHITVLATKIAADLVRPGNPEQAQMLDEQHARLLEEAMEAIGKALLRLKSGRGRGGRFAGAINPHLLYNFENTRSGGH